ncbi:DUF1056 family protein [Paenibacillus sp. J5C2022]|uniref:DUF1056 family protein n=1 Tax=Paenibacillus sp. J5C2022 TaxID=2977129 RepID=UPI00397B2798
MKKLADYIDDLLIGAGLLIATLTTFLINCIAGLYTLSTVLFVVGLFFAITSRKE